jgi:hypothetical protein
MSEDEPKSRNSDVPFLYVRVVLVLLATAFLGAYVAIRVTHGGCAP